MTADAPPDTAPAAPPDTRHAGSEITALANAVRALHHQEARGALASLRRMDARAAIEPAFQRILVKVAPQASQERARRLALFVKVLALPMGLGALTDRDQNLGAAMARAGVSEARVQTLMTARGPALDDLLLRTARRLAHDGVLPFQDIGRLILGDAATAERTRFYVAKAYWTAIPDGSDQRAAAPADDIPAGETE